MGLDIKNGSVFVILWTSLVMIKTWKSKKIKANHENHWFPTAEFMGFDEFVSHELLWFVYFFAYLHSCAIWISFRLSLLLIGIYKRMISFFGEIFYFHDFFVISWVSSSHSRVRNQWKSMIFHEKWRRKWRLSPEIMKISWKYKISSKNEIIRL